MLDAANDAIDKEELAAAFVDLDERVDDWKALKIDSFGELLRYGTFTVIKNDSAKDSEREVRLPLARTCWFMAQRPMAKSLVLESPADL